MFSCMKLTGLFGMMRGMKVMPMRNMCVVTGFLIIAGFVVFGCFAMVTRRMLMMLCGLFVMLGSFVRARHNYSPYLPSMLLMEAGFFNNSLTSS